MPYKRKSITRAAEQAKAGEEQRAQEEAKGCETQKERKGKGASKAGSKTRTPHIVHMCMYVYIRACIYTYARAYVRTTRGRGRASIYTPIGKEL